MLAFHLYSTLPFPQTTLPEDQYEQQPVHFTIASQETSLETPPATAAPPVLPIPKPRTFQPGKGIERKPSSGKLALDEAPPMTAAVEFAPPQEAPSLAPKVPPRRKKSAPATFHLPVLQSNSQLLQDLTCPSSSPSLVQPDTHPLCPQVDDLGPSPAISHGADGPTVTEAEAASFHGDYSDPFWSLLHHPKLLNNNWLSKSSEPLDLGSRNPERTHPGPAQGSASVAERGLLPDHGGKDFSHWVTASNKDKRTTLGV